MKSGWLTLTSAVLMSSWTGMKLANSPNSARWLSSCSRSPLASSVTWGNAWARSSRYFPSIQLRLATAFWTSRFRSTAIATASSSVSTLGGGVSARAAPPPHARSATIAAATAPLASHLLRTHPARSSSTV